MVLCCGRSGRSRRGHRVLCSAPPELRAMRSTTRRRRRTSTPMGVLAIGVVALVGLAAPTLANPALPSLASVPARVARSGASVQQLRAEVEAAQGARIRAEEALVDLLVQRIGLAAAATELSVTEQEKVEVVERSRQNAQELAVAAYVGGSPSALQFLLDADEAGDVTYRQGLVADRMLTARAVEAATRVDVDDLRTLVVDLADRRVRVEGSLEVAHHELALAHELEEEASSRLERAERLAAARVVPRVDPVTGDPTPEAWAALRNCESGANYGAISPSGRYRGAYQFDVATWLTVGGAGDPAAASPEEQDARALILFQRRGAAPWPVCGRFLS
ncbi:MAG: hypothetical protein GY745_22095 [Actinomycetia bacterium]|nr:hypothetical protein [Actinomycetes bacterium]